MRQQLVFFSLFGGAHSMLRMATEMFSAVNPMFSTMCPAMMGPTA